MTFTATRVLIVEPSVDVADRLLKLLTHVSGIHVVGVVGDIPTALERALVWTPHILVTEVILRGGHGFQLLDLLASNHLRPAVVVLTNHPTSFNRARAATAGARYFFDKSSEFDEAVRAVGRLAANRLTITAREA